jgi:hypothetical protein
MDIRSGGCVMWMERLCDAAWLSCPSVSRGLDRNESSAAHNCGVDNASVFVLRADKELHESSKEVQEASR